MQDVIIMELDTNLSFKASIDNPPEVKHSFTTVYVDEKEVKRPTVSQVNGLLEVKLANPNETFLTLFKNGIKQEKELI